MITGKENLRYLFIDLDKCLNVNVHFMKRYDILSRLQSSLEVSSNVG